MAPGVGAGFISIIVVVFMIIMLVLSFLMPVFILRIRKELIQLNNASHTTSTYLSQILALNQARGTGAVLPGGDPPAEPGNTSNPAPDSLAMVTCYHCKGTFPVSQTRDINGMAHCFACCKALGW